MSVNNKINKTGKIPWIDGHCDVLLDVAMKRKNGHRRVLAEQYMEGYKKSGLAALVCSLFLDNTMLDNPLREAMLQISALLDEERETPGLFRLCRTRADLHAAVEKGELAIVLSFEGAEPLGRDVGMLRAFYALGVRFVGLTWSRRNAFADGCVTSKTKPLTPGGLSPLGIDLINKMKEMGMVADISHLNEEGAKDVFTLVKDELPVIASHSCCKNLCAHGRNLTDAQIRAIAASGGLVGVCGVKSFLAQNGADFDTYLQHVEYLLSIAGTDGVGIGLDICDDFIFVPPGGGPVKKEDMFKSHEDASRHWPQLIDRLGEKTAHKVLFGNYFRVIEKVLAGE